MSLVPVAAAVVEAVNRLDPTLLPDVLAWLVSLAKGDDASARYHAARAQATANRVATRKAAAAAAVKLRKL